MNKILIYLSLLAFVLLSGCTASQHKAAVQDDSTERVTVGTVQKEVRVGMSGAEVIEVLGSPNIVSTDELRREVWVYDKIATDSAYSSSSGGILGLIIGAGGSTAGGGGGGFSGQSGAASTSQQTLTIIIKFDVGGLVRDFAYHTSRF